MANKLMAFKLNGKEKRVAVDPNMTLLKFLRSTLGLKGTKNGCSTGHCGACTVIMNGKAIRSCFKKMKHVDNAELYTVEGLLGTGKLHPLQEAFINHGAVQCGFCTSGMLMTAKALLHVNPDPTKEEIKAALTRNRNICRCTGYINIIQAIQEAGVVMRGEKARVTTAEDPYLLGNPIIYEEAQATVTGRKKYGDDIEIAGLLFGKILWSEYPHAEVLNIDISEAEKSPGVKAVVTARDIPGKNQCGIVIRDQPAIAERKVLHIGDTLASIFAETPELAAAAIKKVKVDYRPLAGIFSPEDAAGQNAPKLHENGNLLKCGSVERGDVEAGFRQCSVVIEETYTTPFIEHAFLEPESGIAIPEPDGTLTLKMGTQCVFDDRTQLSEILNMAKDQIRIVQLPTGGAFGAKEDMIIQPHLALGALKTGRPAKITLTRKESLRGHPKRHAAKMRYKTGANAAGKILAIEAEIILDTGAYASLGTDVMCNTLVFGAGPYYVPSLRLAAWAWYTNNVPAGAMRGFGVNQVVVALEQQMDMMARALKIDPFEFRLINALDVGLPTATDHVLEDGVVSIKQTIKAARSQFTEERLSPIEGANIGVGVAAAVKNVGFGFNLPESAGAIVELKRSGKIQVRISQHDYGQGSKVGLIQLAANKLDVAVADIELIGPDTAHTPETGPTTASRQTFMTGNAVLMACGALKDDILSHAASQLNCDRLNLKLKKGMIIDVKRGTEFPLSSLDQEFRVERRYEPPPTLSLLKNEASHYGKDDFESRMTYWCYTYSTQVAIVAAWPDTGVVKVLKVISVNDVGKVINRKVIEGQIYGGVVMGMGYALSEEFILENGILKTDTFGKCNLPTASQIPDIIPIIIEIPHPSGPQGAKGFAEGPSLATAPAILNALYDAIGVRITELPANKNRIKTALRTAETTGQGPNLAEG